MLRLLVLIFAAVGPTTLVLAQTKQADDALTRRIDRLVRDIGIQQDTPGLCILIRQANGFEFKKAYGLADIANKKPITDETLFELASASKPITATGVLILHDRGALALNDDIRKHLPEMPEYGSGQIIRVRDLLLHVSGLPDYMSFENFPSKREGYWNNEDYLMQFAKQKEAFPLSFKPRAKYEYNNSNYMLAAMLVERVSGKPFADFMLEEVFLPAGMTNTFVCDSQKPNPRKALLQRLAMQNRSLVGRPFGAVHRTVMSNC